MVSSTCINCVIIRGFSCAVSGFRVNHMLVDYPRVMNNMFLMIKSLTLDERFLASTDYFAAAFAF